MAGKKKYDYGVFGLANHTVLAHRLAYMLVKGLIPEGLSLLHTCDNPSCVNPAHLTPGTRAENITDRDVKNRQAKGIRHGRAKLTESQVLAIRADPRTQSEIATSYGVSQRQISYIKNSKYWKHLNIFHPDLKVT